MTMFAVIRSRVMLTALGALAASACSIHQKVEPVNLLGRADAEVCIVRDNTVREGFLDTYVSALHSRNISARVVDSLAQARECEMYSTYMGNWRWDLALYLAYAKITVYRGGEKVGEALYDSLGGGGRLDKFIDAETKINELVSELFPL